MADRIFKGQLAPEQCDAFPESAETFDTSHAGGLVPFEMFAEVLGIPLPDRDLKLDGEFRADLIGKSLWIGRGDVLIKIDPDGSIEVGAAGV